MRMMSLQQVNEIVKMYFKRTQNRAEGQMTPEEDLDEFDRILVHIAMQKMGTATSDGMILNM